MKGLEDGGETDRASSQDLTCPFLRIPVELRLAIYRHLLLLPTPVGQFGRVVDDGKPALGDEVGDCKFHLSVLRVNRQIYHEARSVMYGENTFLLYMSCHTRWHVHAPYNDGIGVDFIGISSGFEDAANGLSMPVHEIRRLVIVIADAEIGIPDDIRRRLSTQVSFLRDEKVALTSLRVVFVGKGVNRSVESILLRPLRLLRGIPDVKISSSRIDPSTKSTADGDDDDDDDDDDDHYGTLEELANLVRGNSPLPPQLRSYKVLRVFTRAVSKYYPLPEQVVILMMRRGTTDSHLSEGTSRPTQVDDALRAIEDGDTQRVEQARAQIIKRAAGMFHQSNNLSSGFQYLDPCDFGEYRALVEAEQVARAIRISRESEKND